MAYGEIIMGYSGIGKTTLAREPMSIRVVDLESSPFTKFGKPDNWDKIYCDIAMNLANLGFAVFVSTHKEVQNRFKEIAIEEYKKSKEDEKNKRHQFVVICPSLDLKYKWVEKLAKRYDETKDPKDERAYFRVRDNYDEDIKNLSESGFFVHILKEFDYQLDEEIVGARIGFMQKQRENWNYGFIEE